MSYQLKRVRFAFKQLGCKKRVNIRRNELLRRKMKKHSEKGSMKRSMKMSQVRSSFLYEEDDNPSVSSNLLANVFECPICFDYALPPIHQCKAGHIICSQCRVKCSKSDEDNVQYISCPSCRQPMDEIRNMALEKISSLICFPCKYSTFGCLQKLHSSVKTTHEISCTFKLIRCPLPKSSRGSCRWEGSINDVSHHIIQNHSEVTKLTGQDIIFLAAGVEISAPADWIMLQEAHGKTFLIVFKKRIEDHRVMFDGIALIVGSISEAKKFAYRLALNGRNKRLSWEAVPKSIQEKNALGDPERFKVDEETVNMFAKDDDLAINVVITTNSEYESDEESEVNDT